MFAKPIPVSPISKRASFTRSAAQSAFGSPMEWIKRDEVGVQNILLRAVVDTPNHVVVAVAKRSF